MNAGDRQRRIGIGHRAKGNVVSGLNGGRPAGGNVSALGRDILPGVNLDIARASDRRYLIGGPRQPLRILVIVSYRVQRHIAGCRHDHIAAGEAAAICGEVIAGSKGRDITGPRAASHHAIVGEVAARLQCDIAAAHHRAVVGDIAGRYGGQPGAGGDRCTATCHIAGSVLRKVNDGRQDVLWAIGGINRLIDHQHQIGSEAGHLCRCQPNAQR